MKRYLFLVAVVLLALLSSCEKDGLEYVDPLIGTEGEGTEYGGLMPYIGVPFGSAQWTPMTRLNDVSRLSYNAADTLLLGFIASPKLTARYMLHRLKLHCFYQSHFHKL